MSQITAPFTEEQVKHLNDYQTCGLYEFTCGNDHEGDRTLIATTERWVCPSCGYTQDWAHASMADGSATRNFQEWLQMATAQPRWGEPMREVAVYRCQCPDADCTVDFEVQATSDGVKLTIADAKGDGETIWLSPERARELAATISQRADIAAEMDREFRASLKPADTGPIY